MGKFFFLLWKNWTLRVSIESVLFGFFLAFLMSGYIYIKKGLVDVNQETMSALLDIFFFWFGVLWNVGLLIALFRSIKFVFNRCYNGYMLRLFTCKQDDYIEPVGYGDLIKVWRRWFLILIWSVAFEILIGSIVMRFGFGKTELFSWLGSGVLFGFVLLGGYISFWVLSGWCKRVKVVVC